MGQMVGMRERCQKVLEAPLEWMQLRCASAMVHWGARARSSSRGPKTSPFSGRQGIGEGREAPMLKLVD